MKTQRKSELELAANYKKRILYQRNYGKTYWKKRRDAEKAAWKKLHNKERP